MVLNVKGKGLINILTTFFDFYLLDWTLNQASTTQYFVILSNVIDQFIPAPLQTEMSNQAS